jgi:hypothetical protein
MYHYRRPFRTAKGIESYITFTIEGVPSISTSLRKHCEIPKDNWNECSFRVIAKKGKS